MRILMVEDARGIARGLMALLDDLEDSTQRDVEFRHVPSVGMLKRAIAGGEQWDVALVDFDLGVAQESGLAAMDALSDSTSPPAIVLWTEAYDITHTLGVIAASAWFDIKATYNKIHGFSVAEDTSQFLRIISGVLGGNPPPSPNHLRSPILRTTLGDFLGNGSDYLRWRAFATEQHADAAAAVAHVSPSALRGWMNKEKENGPLLLVDRFWRRVSEAARTDPQSQPRDSLLTTISRKEVRARV